MRKYIAKIPCVDRDARDAIERAMEDDAVRIAVLCIGHLRPFTVATQRRLLTYLHDRFIANPDQNDA